MEGFKTLAMSALLTLVAAADSESCALKVEMAVVQDGSASFVPLLTEMIDYSQTLFEQLSSGYASFRLGISTFVDKPSPFRGVGNGRGVSPDLGQIDYCYSQMVPLSSEVDAIADGFEKLTGLKGVGGDGPENPYEALLYLTQDSSMTFSNDDYGSVARIALVVTDDLPHYEGDAQVGIDWWNPNSGVETDKPHFWSPEFINSAQYYASDSPAIYDPATNADKYSRLLELNEKAKETQSLTMRGVVESKSAISTGLTDDEREEFDGLMKLLGPATVPNAKPHPGSMEAAQSCGEYEYPSLTQVGKALTNAGVAPLVLISPPEYVYYESWLVCQERGFGFDDQQDVNAFVECAQRIYEEDLKTMNLPFYEVASFSKSPEEFAASIQETLNKITVSFDCNPPTMPPSPTECPTVVPAPVMTNDDSGRLSPGAVAGITVGASAGVGLLFGILGYTLRLRSFGKRASSTLKDVELDVEAQNVTVNRDVTQILHTDMFQ